MVPQKEEKNLLNHLQEVETWTLEYKVMYFKRIGEEMPIAVRIIVDNPDLNDSQKIKALKLISELHHEMNKIKNSLTSVVGHKFDLKSMLKYFLSMAKRNDKLIASEIAFCLENAFRYVTTQKVRKNENYDLQPSIYRLFEDEQFDGKIRATIGAENIDNLQGFIRGYFYAIDSNEIRMHGTRAYPDLKKIEEWISKEKEPKEKDWKAMFSKMENKNQVKEFLKIFRQNIVELT